MSGWIKIHRKILDSLVFQDDKYFRVFMYILLKVNHADAEILFLGKKMTVKRGQFLTGRKSLSEAIKMSQTTLERVLKFLEDERMIGQQKTNKFRVISVCNYDQYQEVDNKRTTDGQQMDTNKKNKEELEEEKPMPDESGGPVREIFDFWANVMGKTKQTKLTQERRKKIKARLNANYTVDQIKQAIINCSNSRFHMGQNDGANLHNDLELICRNNTKLDNFLNSYGKGQGIGRSQRDNSISSAERVRRANEPQQPQEQEMVFVGSSEQTPVCDEKNMDDSR